MDNLVGKYVPLRVNSLRDDVDLCKWRPNPTSRDRVLPVAVPYQYVAVLLYPGRILWDPTIIIDDDRRVIG